MQTKPGGEIHLRIWLIHRGLLLKKFVLANSIRKRQNPRLCGRDFQSLAYLFLFRTLFDLTLAFLVKDDLKSIVFTKFIVLRSEKFTFWNVFLRIRTLYVCWTCRLGTLAIGISAVHIILFKNLKLTNVQFDAVFSWCLNMLITISQIYWIIWYKKANTSLFLVSFFSFFCYVMIDPQNRSLTFFIFGDVLIFTEVKCLVKQLLNAVSFLHTHWIIHRDIKMSNLLYNNKGELKLADFGSEQQFLFFILSMTSRSHTFRDWMFCFVSISLVWHEHTEFLWQKRKPNFSLQLSY